MEEILYLEPDEEITSVIDKLKKSKSDSIGLVIPRNSTLVHSIVNLKLLKKEAAVLKKEIALVTADRIGKNIASQVGLPVYEDTHAKRPINSVNAPLPTADDVIEVDMSGGEIESKSSGAPQIKHYAKGGSAPKHNEITFEESDMVSDEREAVNDATSTENFTSRSVKSEPVVYKQRSSKPHSSKRGLIIAAAIFFLVIAVTLLGLPQSTLLVTVAAESFEKSIPLEVVSETEEVTDGALIGKLLEAEKSDARRIVATGKKDVGGKAKGTVAIANSWDSKPFLIPAGTTFTAEGKTFTNTEPTTVPGATAAISEGKLVTVAGKGTATITATEPGDSFNIKASKFTISGLSADQQAKVTAESTKDFSGGFTKQVSVMTQEDIDAAKDALAKDLAKEAVEELHKQKKDLKITDEAVTQEVLSVETNPEAANAETEYFDIKVKAKSQVIAFNEQQLNDAVRSRVDEEVPEDKELLLGEGDEFVIAVESTDYPNGKLVLTGNVKTKIGTSVDGGALKKRILGKNESTIREQLADVPNLKDVAVHSFPGTWWQDVSFFAWNTRVKVIYE